MGGTALDHVVVPLGPMHARAAAGLCRRLRAAVGPSVHVPSVAHLTLVSFRGLTRAAAVAALRPVADTAAPFAVRAHGYGVFSGDGPDNLSLHVMVVRAPALDALHERVRRVLTDAGATPDGLTEPAVWTPHVTLLGQGLTPALLGRAVEVLAARPHPSWDVDVRAIAVSRPDDAAGDVLPFPAGRRRRWPAGPGRQPVGADRSSKAKGG